MYIIVAESVEKSHKYVPTLYMYTKYSWIL